jgi:hypothetical protein
MTGWSFKLEQKRNRDEAAKQTRIDKIKKQQKIKEALVIGVVVVTALVGVGAIIALFVWLAQSKR